MKPTSGRVLVIDDSVLARKRIVQTLRDGGYEVLEAEDGQMGLEVAQREMLDVIISDISMPRLDGIALCKNLKANGATRSVPVVFISAMDSLTDVVRGLEAGASDYLSKASDGPEQILAMAKVHCTYTQELRARGAPRLPDASGEEFQTVKDIPATFFDGMTMGFILVNLRRQPIYVNPAARRYLSLPLDAPVASLAGGNFETFVNACARAYAPEEHRYFYPVKRGPGYLEVHLEQIYSVRKEICGLMLILWGQL